MSKVRQLSNLPTGTTVNLNMATDTCICRSKGKFLPSLSSAWLTYFWTIGWGFTVAVEAGPPTVAEGSGFSVAWFSGLNFLRMGFEGGWEYGASYELKSNIKIKKLKFKCFPTHSVSVPHSPSPVSKIGWLLYSKCTGEDTWLILGLARTGGTLASDSKGLPACLYSFLSSF